MHPLSRQSRTGGVRWGLLLSRLKDGAEVGQRQATLFSDDNTILYIIASESMHQTLVDGVCANSV